MKKWRHNIFVVVFEKQTQSLQRFFSKTHNNTLNIAFTITGGISLS